MRIVANCKKTRLQRIQKARHGTCQHQNSSEPRVAVLQESLRFTMTATNSNSLDSCIPVDEVGAGIIDLAVPADVEQKQVNGFDENHHSVK